MKKDERGRVVELLRRKIPRTKSGDPDFHYVGPRVDGETPDGMIRPADFETHSLLMVFTPEEIVTLVNRAIYQLEYQRGWHRRWEREKAEELEPLKRKVCEMFQLKRWTHATEDQLLRARDELRKEREDVD